MQLDRSGESPLDKCLRMWDGDSISQLLKKQYPHIPSLLLTSACLNKVLANRRLSKQQKEQLIKECLSDKMSRKGYAKVMREKVEVCLPSKGMSKIEGTKSAVFKEGAQKNRLMSTVNYTFSICYSCTPLKTDQDAANLFPLATYLSLYKERADLQVIEALWLAPFAKSNIKKLNLLFMRDQQAGSLEIDCNSSAYQ